MSQQGSHDKAPDAASPTDVAGPSAPVPDTVRRALFTTPATPATPGAQGAQAAVPAPQSAPATPDISTALLMMADKFGGLTDSLRALFPSLASAAPPRQQAQSATLLPLSTPLLPPPQPVDMAPPPALAPDMTRRPAETNVGASPRAEREASPSVASTPRLPQQENQIEVYEPRRHDAPQGTRAHSDDRPLRFAGSPYTDKIVAEPVPPKFRMPAMETYDGSADPEEHVQAFKAHMMLHCSSDALMCKAFPTTLRSAAREWFGKLAPATIGSFAELAEAFTAHFVGSRRIRKTARSLLSIRQKDDEDLAAYVRRFNETARQIASVHPSYLMDAFVEGLKVGRFKWSLVDRPPINFHDVLQRAGTYMEAEAQMGERTKKTEPKKRTRDDSRPTNRESPARDKNPRVTQPPRIEGRFERYTPLRVTLVEAYEVASEQRLLPEPRPMRPNPGRQSSTTYCRYHRDRGHDTNDCRQLRDEIESLIRRGHLRGCAGDDRGKKPAATPSNPPAERVIDMIFGGPGAGGDSKRARKAYARQGAVCSIKRGREEGDDCLMTFGPLDAAGLDPDHDDALVITARISNAEVRRVMVDTGSSADLLYWTTLKRMGLDKAELSPYDGDLHGFAGDTVRPRGAIDLHVTVGAAPRARTIKTRFLVVDVPAAYNAILGRPTLNKLGAAVSTYHMVMKFPTPSGVGEARSDPKLSRDCYLASLSLPRSSTNRQLSGRDDGAQQTSPESRHPRQPS